MFGYQWDPETGGIILVDAVTSFNKEARPVYARELELLKVNWKFDKQNDYPYMWSESNNYWYRGRLVAKAHNGCIYKCPDFEIIEEPEPDGKLKPIDIDAMVDKNRERLEILIKNTERKIYNYYIDYRNKVDIFYVAFSGGKDSLVILDLVQRTLPHNAFKVLFGDTGMEFSDTYELIDKVQKWCEAENIEFIRSQSHLNPVNSWQMFGPPAQILRWCCSVHKTTPQILKLREITQNPQFRGLAFTGIRADESTARSEYDEISFGEKVRGQYSCHAMLNWTSVEVFLYIYQENLLFNEAYKKGNGRVGCLVCPLAASKNMFFKEQSYHEQTYNSLGTDIFNQIILKTTAKNLLNKEAEVEFMNIAGWKARRSGRELNFVTKKYTDKIVDGYLHVYINKISEELYEWVKTLGKIASIDEHSIDVIFEKQRYHIEIRQNSDGYEIVTNVDNLTKKSIKFGSLLKNVFRKTAYCVHCRVCEANCPYGFISMQNGKTVIHDKCIKCHNCHDIYCGCLVASSLKLPNEEKKMAEKSILTYSNLGVENSWICDYIRLQDEFWDSEFNPQNKKTDNLKKLLIHSEIVDNKYHITNFGKLISNIGVNTEISWGLMLCNLAYTPTFRWWLLNVVPNIKYTMDTLKTLISDDNTNNVKDHVVSAMKNILISNQILANNIGIGMCDYELKGVRKLRILKSIERKTWLDPDPRVILYSLFKYAEACDHYYQFTLTRLLNHEAESAGMSPTLIFNLDREVMTRVLNGLSIDYPEFINASFTHDLDNIHLNSEKTSEDVLALF